MRQLMLLLVAILVLSTCTAQDKAVQSAEAKRIAAIEKVRPTVTAVFGPGGGGGGSGVVISPDGYCLTNFHVAQPCGNFLYCGLADGTLYEAVIVSNDPVGDVALIKLIPKEAGKPFPYAAMGDSDKVQMGDWAIAMGNPFLLATDFTPTVTFGIISGTHRYQGPAGIILEYTDCLQTEASINPGNSGGPLFNLNGEIIGINGRGSFEKRGRVNSGAGYAISINQIKNFMGHFKAGLNVDHATLGAIVKTEDDGRMRVTKMLEASDAFRRGMREGDELLSFAGRSIGSVNQYKNVLGIYPKGWRLPMTFLHMETDGDTIGTRRESLVRLAGVQAREVKEDGSRKDREQPNRPPATQAPTSHAGRKLFRKKAGFTNYFFNELEQARVLKALDSLGKFNDLAGVWNFAGEVERPIKNPFVFVIDDKQVSIKIDKAESIIEPLKAGETPENLSAPAGSGGLAMTLYHWRRMLIQRDKGFDAAFFYAGTEPFYPSGQSKDMVLTDVLQTEYAATTCKWYFDITNGKLLGCECWLIPDTDPCELSFFDYKPEGSVQLPGRILVRHADRDFGYYRIDKSTLAKGAARVPEKKDDKKAEENP